MKYLARDDVHLPQVEEELDRLRDAAEDAFESSKEMPEVERSQLLRRQVARRCIYGADVNDLSTELARLSLWVHTFVPGLPLAFLDYNLTTGDSLAGIGTLDEVSDILDVKQTNLGMFMGGSSVMKDIEDAIDELGSFADADAQQVAEARETREKIQNQLEETRAAFDILAASRIDDEIDPEVVQDEELNLTETDDYETAQDALATTNPLHFPTSFPEVFNGNDPGFDVIVGNPPWEKAKIEQHAFWARYFPGIQRSLSQAEREERIEELIQKRPDLQREYGERRQKQEALSSILTNGPYPGIGGGDPDMYLAFAWRFWSLANTRGDIGVVLPRGAFGNSSSEKFRRKMLEEGEIKDITFIKNHGSWAFEGVGGRYTIGLLSFSRIPAESDATVPLRGPFASAEDFEEGVSQEPYRFDVSVAKEWTETATFPLLPADTDAVEAFGQLAETKNLNYSNGDWKAVPSTELHATQDKTRDDGTRIMHFVDDPPKEYWPVYKGSSFDHWMPDTGDRYAWADPEVAIDHVQESRENSYRYAGSRSSFSEFSEEWVKNKETLPSWDPRIAFRDITQRTNSRTTIPALVPPEVFLNHTAPYFLWPRGSKQDEAYLLGVLSSIPLDWYSRRFVEVHLTYHILNALPVPRPGHDSALRQRVVKLSGRLAAIDNRYAEWADEVGVDYGPLDDDKKQKMIYELDAVVAHLYGLSRENLQVIFETFHDNWDHEPRMNAVLEHYDEWAERREDEE